MIFQIQFLIMISQKTNEGIINLIDHEYIDKSFYSIEDLCKNLSMYLWQENLDYQTCYYPN